MKNLIVEYSANLYDAIVACWFIMKFNKVRFVDTKYYLILFCLISFAVSNIFTHTSDLPVLLHSAIQTVILLLYSFTLKNGRLLNKILAPLIFETVLIIGNSMVLFCISNFSGISILELSTKSFIGRYVHIFICKLVMTAILAIILRIFVIEERFTAVDFLAYLLFPVVSVINLNIFMSIGYEYDISKHTTAIIIVVCAIAVINILVLVLFKNTVRNTTASYELEMINSRKELEEQKYTELRELYDSLALTRHDLKDHLIYIEALISQKRYDEANNYIRDRKSEISDSRRIKVTGDRLLDYIINSKLSHRKDITLVVSGRIEPLPRIEELDLVSLYGNILDNAIEGTEGCEEKYIELSFSLTGNYQSVICKNTVPSSVLKNNAGLATTKRDKKAHGYGIKSIRRVVDKYSGLIEFSEVDGRFCVQVAFPVKERER